MIHSMGRGNFYLRGIGVGNASEVHEHGLYGLQAALIGVMVALRVLFAAGSYCRQNAECPRLRRYARRLEFLVGYGPKDKWKS